MAESTQGARSFAQNGQLSVDERTDNRVDAEQRTSGRQLSGQHFQSHGFIELGVVGADATGPQQLVHGPLVDRRVLP